MYIVLYTLSTFLAIPFPGCNTPSPRMFRPELTVDDCAKATHCDGHKTGLASTSPVLEEKMKKSVVFEHLCQVDCRHYIDP